MKKITTRLFTQLIGRLFFLVLLLLTNANCNNCGNQFATTPKKTYENNHLEDNEDLSGTLGVELTSTGQATGSDLIAFQLTNCGTQEIDLKKVMINLSINDKKDFTNIKTQTGALSPIFANNNLQISSGKGIHGKSAYDFTGQSKLSAGESANIQLRIINLEELASALVTCEVEGYTNKTGKAITQSVPIKFLVPIAKPRKGDIIAIIKNVQFTGTSSELSCELAFKNVSNRTISLSSLALDLGFDGPIQGKISKKSQELFSKVNSLEAGKSIDVVPITAEIDNQDAINNLKYCIGTSHLSLTMHIVTEANESICDLINQSVKLTSPDLEEVGPKQGSTMGITIAPVIELTQIKSGQYQLAISFQVKNTSSHPIDLSQINVSISLDGIANGHQGASQFKLDNSIAILNQNTSTAKRKYLIPLDDMTLAEAENYLTEDTYNFTMTLETLDGKHQLGAATQQLQFAK